jgi:hypothetical protein
MDKNHWVIVSDEEKEGNMARRITQKKRAFSSVPGLNTEKEHLNFSQ